MRKSELIELRRLVNEERNRRRRNIELKQNAFVKEFIEINGILDEEGDPDRIKQILNGILPTFEITKTNGIYVFIKAHGFDTYPIKRGFDGKTYTVNGPAMHRDYKDIESNEVVTADSVASPGGLLISTFESNHLVLDPYHNDPGVVENGFYEVQLDFFENAYKFGQPKAKRFLLDKYSKLN